MDYTYELSEHSTFLDEFFKFPNLLIKINISRMIHISFYFQFSIHDFFAYLKILSYIKFAFEYLKNIEPLTK